MTALHVVLLQGKKSAEDTLQTAKLLMEHGLRELINEADSLGNTPLHVLIVRFVRDILNKQQSENFLLTQFNNTFFKLFHQLK
jgi:hypothetical protein